MKDYNTLSPFGLHNGVEYYNIEEQRNNIGEHIATTLRDVSSGKASPSSASPLIQEGLAQEFLDSREREVVMEGEEEAPLGPLGPHNVKRAIVHCLTMKVANAN
tara:strand:- start:59 stop:370 length:312 start_codon:yes stop_codon:yes gene_type:complete